MAKSSTGRRGSKSSSSPRRGSKNSRSKDQRASRKLTIKNCIKRGGTRKVKAIADSKITAIAA